MAAGSSRAGSTGRRPARRRVSARGEGARLRVEIIEAAVALVEDGADPASLSLRAVARRVGVAATSIYLHFDSLDTLLSAVKSELWGRFGEGMQRAASRAPGTAYGRIRAFGDAYVAFARENPGAYRILFATTWNVPPAEGEEFIGEAQFGLVTDALRLVVDDPAEARMRAIQLWCGVHGLVSLRTQLTGFPWPDLSDQLDDLTRRLTTPPAVT